MNVVRVHTSLRMSPAMAAGVSDRLWDMADIVALVDAAASKPGRRGSYKKKFKLRHYPWLPCRDNGARLGYSAAAGECDPMKQVKVIVEKHPEGYVAYPLGLKGVVVGEGDSYEEVLADVRSAIRFHIETFGAEAVGEESPVLEAFVAEAAIAE